MPLFSLQPQKKILEEGRVSPDHPPHLPLCVPDLNWVVCVMVSEEHPSPQEAAFLLSHTNVGT